MTLVTDWFSMLCEIRNRDAMAAQWNYQTNKVSRSKTAEIPSMVILALQVPQMG